MDRKDASNIFKYAIPINENTRDLIASINGELKPEIEDGQTYFIFDAIAPTTCRHSDIVKEDDLYDDKGMSKIGLIWLIT